MKKKKWNDALDHIDEDIIEEFVEKSEQIYKSKQRRAVFIRISAVAACFCIMVGSVITAPMLRNRVPKWDEAQYSAEDVGRMFNILYDSVETNYYQTLCVLEDKYLYIDPIPEAEYLGIYGVNRSDFDIDKEEFGQFIDGIQPEIESALDVDLGEYKLGKGSYSSLVIGNFYYGRGDELSASLDVENYIINVTQNEELYRVYISGGIENEGRISLNGETLSVDQRLSDDEILESLDSAKKILFEIFGVKFSDAKVIRQFSEYSENGLVSSIDVYFYNAKAHPLNSTESIPVSDYISLSFVNGAFWSKEKSDGIIADCSIDYHKNRSKIKDRIPLVAKAKRLSIEEAEEFLYKGYVFGGHTCDLCMAEREKISFEGYDYVDMEYMFGYGNADKERVIAIPFYAFYKNIGTAENGNLIYAKTYVAAIEISGYEEYFQKQKDAHLSNIPIDTVQYKKEEE